MFPKPTALDVIVRAKRQNKRSEGSEPLRTLPFRFHLTAKVGATIGGQLLDAGWTITCRTPVAIEYVREYIDRVMRELHGTCLASDGTVTSPKKLE